MQFCSIWIGGFIVIALYFLIEDFIGVWLGAEYIMSKYVLIAILCNVFYDIVKQPIYAFREAIGMYKKVQYIMLICAIVNIILSILLGMKWGTAGIIFASFIAKMTTTLWYEARLLFHDYFELDLKDYLLPIIYGILTCIFCSIICALIMRLIVVTNIIGWLFKGVVCTITINLFYLLRYCQNEDLHLIIGRFIKKKNNAI